MSRHVIRFYKHVKTSHMIQLETFPKYRISANSFRGNYSFLNLTLCTVTFGHSTYRCGNYSREETIQGRKLFAEIRYAMNSHIRCWVSNMLMLFLKYGSEEKGSSLCKCSILLGFIMSKNLRGL